MFLNLNLVCYISTNLDLFYFYFFSHIYFITYYFYSLESIVTLRGKIWTLKNKVNVLF